MSTYVEGTGVRAARTANSEAPGTMSMRADVSSGQSSRITCAPGAAVISDTANTAPSVQAVRSAKSVLYTRYHLRLAGDDSDGTTVTM